LKKILKSIFKLNSAKPLVEKSKLAINIQNEPKYFYKSYGSLNPDKLFYIIQRSPGAGFFSNLLFVLNHIACAEKIDAIPVIDNKNFPNLYNQTDDNSWEYYFKPLNNYTLEEVYFSKNVIITDFAWPKCFPTSLTNNNLLDIYKRYIHIKDDIIEDFNTYYNNNFKNKLIIGVHFRGKEQRIAASHPFPPTFKQIFEIIKYLNQILKFDSIFIITENSYNLNKFINKFNKKLIYYNSSRSSSNVYNLNPRNSHRYLLGREILIETLLLSKCDYIICGDSNVSEFAKLLSKNKNKIYQINNGINSDNGFISKFLWYIKCVLPCSFGGFENNILNKINLNE
jgi:hypothetical protein